MTHMALTWESAKYKNDVNHHNLRRDFEGTCMPLALEGSGALGNETSTHPLCPWFGGAPEKGLDMVSFSWLC